MEKIEKPALAESMQEKLQIGCLVFFGIVSAMMMASIGDFKNWLIYEFASDYLIVPAVLFLGLSISGTRSALANRHILAGIAMVLWLLVAQAAQRAGGEWPKGTGMWWGAYLLALPFASVMKDGAKQKGLRIIAAVAILLSLILALYAGMLILDILPAAFRKYVYWDGARLNVIWHSNINACCFMVGIGFTLFSIFKVEKRWCKGLLLAAGALQFVMMVLTNSRTSILVACALIAGMVFFLVFKGGWKRFLAGGLAALAVFVALFALSGVIYDKHYEVRLAEYVSEVERVEPEAEPVSALPTASGQGTLANDMRTLNGRTSIWRAALRAMKYRPAFLLRGTADVPEAIRLGDNRWMVGHAHNSWVELLVGYGLPGLMFALYFTFVAVRGALFLLLKGANAMSQKCIALLVLCLLMTGALEPYLFTGYFNFHFTNVAFFLCIGYVNLWYTEARHPDQV